MSSAIQYHPHYTVANYMRWEGDWELLHGVAISMSPSAFGEHCSWASVIASKFIVALGERNRREVTVVQELDWIVDEDTVVRPDNAIIKGKAPARHMTASPILITEILSASTREKDETAKFRLYEEQGVKYYLLADPDKQSLVVYQLVRGRYVLQEGPARYSFPLTRGCTIEIDFGDLLK